MEFEDFLEKIGGLGPFQRRIGTLLILIMIPCAFQIFTIIFTAAKPDFLCIATESWPNSTVPWAVNGDNQTLVIKTNETTMQMSQCSLNIISTARGINTTQSIPCTGWEYDKHWYGSTTVTQWDLICDRRWMVVTARSVFMVGFLVGSLGFGILSDKFGRKKSFLLTTFAQLAIGVATAFSPNYTVFVVFRFLNGAVTIGQVVTGFVLCMELLGNYGRSVFGFIMMSLSGVVYFILTGLAYSIREWWKLQLIVTIPSALMLSYYFLVPESPRWLLLHDRKDQARDIMKKMAETNGFPSFNVNEVEVKNDDRTTGTYLDLVRTPTLRIRSLSVSFIWMTNSLVYYGLTFNTANLAGNPYVNHAIAAGVEMVSSLLCILLFEKFGRRIPQFGALLFCGLALVCVLAVPEELTAVTITLTMMGKFLIIASYDMVYVYTAEIFPTIVRNQAVGGGSMSARIGSIIAPYIAELGNNSMLVPSVTFGICSFVSAVLVLLVMPETKGRALPDTIQEGENISSIISTRGCLCTKPKKAAMSQHGKSVSTERNCSNLP